MAALFGISEENATNFMVGDDMGASISYSKESVLVTGASTYSDSFSVGGAHCGMTEDEVKKVYSDAGYDFCGHTEFDDCENGLVYTDNKIVIEVKIGDGEVFEFLVYQYDDYDLSFVHQ